MKTFKPSMPHISTFQSQAGERPFSEVGAMTTQGGFQPESTLSPRLSRPGLKVSPPPCSNVWDFGSVRHLKQLSGESTCSGSTVDSVFELSPAKSQNSLRSNYTYASYLPELDDTSPQRLRCQTSFPEEAQPGTNISSPVTLAIDAINAIQAMEAENKQLQERLNAAEESAKALRKHNDYLQEYMTLCNEYHRPGSAPGIEEFCHPPPQYIASSPSISAAPNTHAIDVHPASRSQLGSGPALSSPQRDSVSLTSVKARRSSHKGLRSTLDSKMISPRAVINEGDFTTPLSPAPNRRESTRSAVRSSHQAWPIASPKSLSKSPRQAPSIPHPTPPLKPSRESTDPPLRPLREESPAPYMNQHGKSSPAPHLPKLRQTASPMSATSSSSPVKQAAPPLSPITTQPYRASTPLTVPTSQTRSSANVPSPTKSCRRSYSLASRSRSKHLSEKTVCEISSVIPGSVSRHPVALHGVPLSPINSVPMISIREAQRRHKKGGGGDLGSGDRERGREREREMDRSFELKQGEQQDRQGSWMEKDGEVDGFAGLRQEILDFRKRMTLGKLVARFKGEGEGETTNANGHVGEAKERWDWI